MNSKNSNISSYVYSLTYHDDVEGLYASEEAAEAALFLEQDSYKVRYMGIEKMKLHGGVVHVSERVAPAQTVPEPAKPSKAKTKTDTSAQQRAANAKGGKFNANDLPEKVQKLLNRSGYVFQGMEIVVTGVPPTLGRKNAETLVELYGGSLSKTLKKTTSYVVVGNKAGPVKLQKIEELGLDTLNEDQLVELIEEGMEENGGKGPDRWVDNDDEDEDEEDDEPEVKPAKKQKRSA